MSLLSTATEVVLINSAARASTMMLPLTTAIPNRLLVFKDALGTASTNTITLSTMGADIFENGLRTLTLSNTYDRATLVAGPSNRWYVLDGTNMAAANIDTLRTTLLVGGSGGALFGSNVSVGGGLFAGSSFSVAGVASFGSNLTLAGGATLISSLSVAGIANFASNVNFAGAVSTLAQVSMVSSLSVAAPHNVSFGNNLTVTASTITGPLFPRMVVVGVTGTALTTGTTPPLNTTLSGIHYNITNSGFNSFSCPSAITTEGFFYVLRNNTTSYITATQTGGVNPTASGQITIAPATSMTLVYSTQAGNTNNWIIF